jgi:hypothetical protein
MEFLDSLFKSVTVAPAEVMSSPRDLWENVKIPRIEDLEQSANAITTG